jgi:glutaredoxin 3
MAAERVRTLASQRAVVIFRASNCCMCHAVQTLFTEMGVSWAVHELDKDPRGKDVESALAGMVGRSPPVPTVFIGGALVGPTDRVMSLHLGGQLVPLLRQAGALWL